MSLIGFNPGIVVLDRKLMFLMGLRSIHDVVLLICIKWLITVAGRLAPLAEVSWLAVLASAQYWDLLLDSWVTSGGLHALSVAEIVLDSGVWEHLTLDNAKFDWALVWELSSHYLHWRRDLELWSSHLLSLWAFRAALALDARTLRLLAWSPVIILWRQIIKIKASSNPSRSVVIEGTRVSLVRSSIWRCRHR